MQPALHLATLVAVRGRAVLVITKGQRPQPWLADRRAAAFMRSATSAIAGCCKRRVRIAPAAVSARLGPAQFLRQFNVTLRPFVKPPLINGGSFGGDERRRRGEPAETPFPPTEVGDRGTQMLAGEIGP
jgi:hypothetical protein